MGAMADAHAAHVVEPHFDQPQTWAGPGAHRGARLVQSPDLPELVAGYVRAEKGAARAAASLERLVALCQPVAEQIVLSACDPVSGRKIVLAAACDTLEVRSLELAPVPEAATVPEASTGG